MRSAGVPEDGGITVDLDALAETARQACVAFAEPETDPESWAAVVAGRLAETSAAGFGRRRPPALADLAVIRLPALALAAEADARRMRDTGARLRAVAAGITLLQRRVAGEAPLEAILLARA